MEAITEEEASKHAAGVSKVDPHFFKRRSYHSENSHTKHDMDFGSVHLKLFSVKKCDLRPEFFDSDPD